jgi:hypothetical protein
VTHDGRGTDLETLQRWEDSGGTWVGVSRAADSVTISLRRCDGGEEADRLVSSEPGVLTLTEVRHTSEE